MEDSVRNRIKVEQASANNPTVEEMTLIGEAVGEGLPGMIAVAEVLRNRAKVRGTTMEEEALRPKQFSMWNGGLQKGMKFAYENENFWPLAKQAMEAAKSSNSTGGANLYHADYVKPNWDMSKIKKTTKIGKHIFYNEPGQR